MSSDLREEWIEEEKNAVMIGWDFSHLEGRYEEEQDLPWDYKTIVKSYLKDHHRLLDMETGGGEFLLSLEHPFDQTTVTENFPPNVAYCKEHLTPKGIRVLDVDTEKKLPIEDESFDIVINRHGSFLADEIRRILKPGGYFVTQQVGYLNDRELIEALLPGTPIAFPEVSLEHIKRDLERAGLEVLQAREHFGSIRFFDLGALVWFASITPWEFPGFNVESCYSRLLALHKDLPIEGRTHRLLFVVRKDQGALE